MANANTPIPAGQEDHSKLGASSMYRWSMCPGSVAKCAALPKKASSKYADEGSDAHALLAHCLKNEESPDFYTDRKCNMENRSFTPDKDTTDAVQVAWDWVMEKFAEGFQLWVEERFNLESVHTGCFGTADIVLWNAHEQLLIVADYKHGAGIFVKVHNNSQAQYYSLGALLQLNLPAKRVKMVIIQPRCGDLANAVREWEIDAIDLLDFRADLKRFAIATEQKDAPLIAGDHCGFCAAAATCEELSGRAQALAKIEFAPDLPYDSEQLAIALEGIPKLKAWISALDKFAYNEAEAGRPIPRHKLVAKRAIRKWEDIDAAAQLLKEVVDADKANKMFEPVKLKSPAQVEKIVGKGVIDDLVTKESSGNVLVPIDDDRPAVGSSAKQQFEKVPLTIENGEK